MGIIHGISWYENKIKKKYVKKNKSHRMGKHYLSIIAVVKSNRRIVVDMDRAIELKILREIWWKIMWKLHYSGGWFKSDLPQGL